MRIFVTGKNGYQGLQAGDGTFFASIANSVGHELASELDSAEVLVCVDYNSGYKGLISKARRRGIPTYLIQQEPYVVFPEHRYPNPGGVFDFVFRKGIPGEVTRNYGNSWIMSEDWESKRESRFVAITANKWSALPGQLYSLRREVYANSDLVDLYGRGWDKKFIGQLEMISKEIILGLRARSGVRFPSLVDLVSSPTNYLGPVEDKLATMSRYDFSLIIENSGHYMSEKLLDSLLAGTLPVYVGAPIKDFGIPAKFVLQAEPNIGSVLGKMNEALEADPSDFRRSLKKWLEQDETVAAWRAESVTFRILEEIERKANAVRKES